MCYLALPYEDYSSLDVDYIKTNKDIQYDFFNETGAKNARAIYLHLQTTDEGYYRNSIHFVINTLDRYIYLTTANSNYRSLNKVSIFFIGGFNVSL